MTPQSVDYEGNGRAHSLFPCGARDCAVRQSLSTSVLSPLLKATTHPADDAKITASQSRGVHFHDSNSAMRLMMLGCLDETHRSRSPKHFINADPGSILVGQRGPIPRTKRAVILMGQVQAVKFAELHRSHGVLVKVPPGWRTLLMDYLGKLVPHLEVSPRVIGKLRTIFHALWARFEERFPEESQHQREHAQRKLAHCIVLLGVRFEDDPLAVRFDASQILQHLVDRSDELRSTNKVIDIAEAEFFQVLRA